VNVTVREAAAAYTDYAKSLGLSESYIRTQTGYLSRFAKCCDDNAASLGNRAPLKTGSLKPQYVARFFSTLPATAGSHNRALSALKQFMRFLERMEYIPRGEADWLLGDRSTKKFTRKPKYYIPVSQFGPMLDAAGRRHPVDRITLALAFYTLGRQGEIAGLRLKDLDWETKTIRLYRPKRKRWTVVQICPELAEELFRWICFYASELGLTETGLLEDHPDWYLAPGLDCIKGRTPTGEYDAKLTTYRINPLKEALRLEKLVKRMLDIFGAQTEDGKVRKHLGEGMHTVRRSGARAMLDYLANVHGEDKALLMVSTMLDHETTTMTLLYIGRSLERKRLNDYLAHGSMYGDHGRSDTLGPNVVRMPSVRPQDERRAPRGAYPIADYPSGSQALTEPYRAIGEVDAY
jgi:integrase